MKDLVLLFAVIFAYGAIAGIGFLICEKLVDRFFVSLQKKHIL